MTSRILVYGVIFGFGWAFGMRLADGTWAFLCGIRFVWMPQPRWFVRFMHHRLFVRLGRLEIAL